MDKGTKVKLNGVMGHGRPIFGVVKTVKEDSVSIEWYLTETMNQSDKIGVGIYAEHEYDELEIIE